jgi:hypothetical protein
VAGTITLRCGRRSAQGRWSAIAVANVTAAVASREVRSGPDDAADPHVRVVEDVSALVGGSDADAGVVVHVSVRIDASDPDAGMVVDVRKSGHVGASSLDDDGASSGADLVVTRADRPNKPATLVLVTTRPNAAAHGARRPRR